MRRSSKLALVLSLAAVVAATLTPLSPASAGGAVRLKVMSFNIWYGGDEVALGYRHWCYDPAGCPETMEKVLEAIEASGADIVGMQEGTGNAPVIAERLGWYVNERLQVISRFPLVDPPGGDGDYVFAEVTPGRFVAMANVHLPSDPYGPYLVRDGGTLDELLELETSLRLPAVQKHLTALPALAKAGVPVFMTGDFNSPSHLDWTEQVAAVRPEVAYPVEWPVSAALAGAGMRDSYREAYPDPVGRPGFTWTPPGSLESDPQEVDDRIDWVLTAGPTSTVTSQIVGEPGGPDVDIEIDPYPSDHRGVVSTFDVVPGDPADFVAVGERRVFTGDRLDVLFHASGKPGEKVGVVPAGSGAGSLIASKSTGGVKDGSVAFGTGTWKPKAYEAVLLTPSGSIVSRSPFWLYEEGTPATVWTSKARYEPGEPIVVSWAAAPGWKWDWLGMYKAGKNPEPQVEGCTGGYCGNLHYLLYEYTGATIEGTTRFDESSWPGYTTWPLGPGRYRVRMLLDDGYKTVAVSARFRIMR